MRTKWTDEMLAAEAAKYQTRMEFQHNSYAAYQSARRKRLLNTICVHMTTQYATYTKEILIAEAGKYKTRMEFRNKSLCAYKAARSRKLLDEICAHMIAQHITWTTEMLAAEAAKYQTRKDFERGSLAYYTARDRKLLDEICAHMVDGFTSSDNDAIYIWRAVRMSYNGESVYKLGVTSARLGTRRIDQVAQEAGLDYELILCQPVQGKATDLEKKLHLLGEDPKLEGFNGSTEFRALSDSALATAVAMINLNVQE
jgi:hypothetical protein